jgi:hypothetical protein
MNEGNGIMTYVTTCDSPAISGIPAVALRVGLALEKWATTAAERDARRTPATPSGAGAGAAHDIRVTRLF